MARTKTPSPVPTGINMSDVTVTMQTAANEHTRDAVEALARAAQANAEAIKEAARALRGPDNAYGLYLGNPAP